MLKPGGHLVAFGGCRTYHRLVCAIEDAGFEIRDQIGWVFGSGFPKSHDVSKGIDKAAGADREVVGVNAFAIRGKQRNTTWTGDVWGDNGATITAPATDAARQWQGWGTALKPAWEPICLARKPLIGTVASNVLAHGTGALNIDVCRVEGVPPSVPQPVFGVKNAGLFGTGYGRNGEMSSASGRWPANLIHDGSAEVLAGFPEPHGAGAACEAKWPRAENVNVYGKANEGLIGARHGDSGSAARFFYTAKADADDRLRSKHPTVKPVDLMAYLCRLVTPPGGTVLDPFAGSGSTGMACMRESFDCLLIEREAEYVADIRYRLEHVDGSDTPLFAAPPMASDKPMQLSLLDPYADGWPDAAANSKGCYDVAIEAMREQLVKEQTS